MSNRVISKNLAAQEDLLFGEGLQSQKRAGGNYVVSKIRAIYPVNSLEELNSLDPDKFPKARLYTDNGVEDYVYTNGQYERVVYGAKVLLSTEIPSANLAVNESIVVPDRGNSIFKVEPTGTADSFGVIKTANGLYATVTSEYSNKLVSYGTGTDAFISASSLAGQQNTIHFPYGENEATYVFRYNEIKGEGTGTVLKGSSDVAPTVTVQRKLGTEDWDFWKISDLKIVGKSRLANACVQFDPADPFAGRALFDNVTFKLAQKGVEKPTGNIGDGYYGCNFQDLDFGWYAKSSKTPVMHTGAVTFQQTNWDVIEKACIKATDEVDGPGAITVRDSLMQGCNGFGVFMQQNNFVPAVPHTFDNLWIELVAKNPTTVIDGVTYDTREMYFEDTVYAVVKGSYVKSMQLVNSVIHLQDCRMDDASAEGNDYLVDNSSIMIVDNVFGNGEIGGTPYVRSIANQVNTAAAKNCSVRGPLKTNRINLSAISNATNICSNSYSGAGPWGFTGTSSVNATQVSDGILGDTCAELAIPNGATLLSAEVGTPTNGKYAVWGIHAKKVSGGDLDLANIGFNWTAGDVYLRDNQWVCSYGIKKIGSADTCRLRFINNSGAPVTLRLADFFCVEFDTFEEAIEFVNSGHAIKN